MSKSRIAVTTTTFPRWKGDTQPPFVFELSKRLSGFLDVHVLAPYATGAEVYEELEGLKVHRYRYLPFGLGTLAYDGGIVPKLKKNRLYYLQVPFLVLSQFVSLTKLISSKQINLIHAHWIIPQGVVAVLCKLLVNRRLKVLVTAHGGDILGFNGKLGTCLKRFVFRHVDCLTVVSNALRDEAVKLGCNSKIHVMPMGVDTKKFSPDRRNNLLRSEYGISGPFLLFVGRLVEKKGLEYLLRAMPAVLASYPSAKLLIIGSGPLQNQLEGICRELKIHDAIIFAGAKPHDQLPEYFASADIFIGPSIVAESGDSEGFGLVFAEAMSCGTPVVASDLPAVRDIVVDGKTGVLVKQKNCDQLAEVIIAVLVNDTALTELRKFGRKHIIDNFDWEIVTNYYIDKITSRFSTMCRKL